jgi:hypothetical protein
VPSPQLTSPSDKISNFSIPPWLSSRNENSLCTRYALYYHSSTKYLFCNQRLNGIAATLRETQGPDDTPETLEAERVAAQEFIDTAEPLTEEEQALKEKYTDAGFHAWTWRIL